MKAVEVLDVLGNETRRRILQLLADRPCYFSEICERLDVAPKAVLSHLEIMEKAGIVTSFEEKQRKYFQIARNLHIRVLVSPFLFGTNVEEIGDERFSISRVERLINELERAVERCSNLREIATSLNLVRELQREICSMHKYAQRIETELIARCAEIVDEIADDPLEAEILFHLIKRGDIDRAREILEISDEEFNIRLKNLMKDGIIKVRGGKIFVEER